MKILSGLDLESVQKAVHEDSLFLMHQDSI